MKTNFGPVGLAIANKLNKTTNAPAQISLLQNPASLFDALVRSSNSSGAIATNAMTLFPDIKTTADIVVNSTLAPNDLLFDKLKYSLSESPANSGITSAVLALVEEEIETTYELSDKVPDIIKRAMFIDGAVPVLIIPESNLDDLINVNKSSENLDTAPKQTSLDILRAFNTSISAEAFSKELGIVTNKPTRAKENFTYGVDKSAKEDQDSPVSKALAIDIRITDDVFSLREIARGSVLRNNAKEELYGLPSVGKLKSKFVLETKGDTLDVDKFYKTAPGVRTSGIQVLRKPGDASRLSIAKPLVTFLPSMCVTPIVSRGDNKKQLGFLLLLDESGQFLSPKSMSAANKYMQGFSSNIDVSGLQGVSRFLMEQAISADSGNNPYLDASTFATMTRLFNEILENELADRLRNGVLGESGDTHFTNDVLQLMLARSMQNKLTRILYVPAEMITYVAFDYNANGVGKSVFEDMAILLSIRALFMYANTLTTLNNAVQEVNIEVTLDPDIPTVDSTVEDIMDAIYASGKNKLPIGVVDPTQLSEWFARAGKRINFTNHPSIPDTKIAYNYETRSLELPTKDLEEDLRKRTILAMGASPEMVDSAQGSELATGLWLNNQRTVKTISNNQAIVSKHLQDMVRKMLKYDPIFIDKVIGIMHNNIEEVMSTADDALKARLKTDNVLLNDYCKFLAMSYIDRLEVTLPKPDNKSLESKMAEYDGFAQAVDSILANFIDTSLLGDDVLGEAAGAVDKLKTILGAKVKREYITSHGIMPEVSDLFSATEEDSGPKATVDDRRSHVTSVLKMLLPLMLQESGLSEAAKQLAEKFNISITATDSTDMPAVTSGDGSTEGGDDDFGEGDGGFGEEPAEETEDPDSTDTSDAKTDVDATVTEDKGPSDNKDATKDDSKVDTEKENTDNA